MKMNVFIIYNSLHIALISIPAKYLHRVFKRILQTVICLSGDSKCFGIVKKSAVREHPKSEIDRYQAAW